ncbi:MAG: histidine phosphatase family protein [Candidatus Nomurabacteria bacterium]|jgi:broad specificity phosphatase PhoE|nr:histidine phosphatase family protein [Candidatus Nomurabacteria bacterium]
MAPNSITFIRHAENTEDDNLSNNDLPLSEHGKRQAEWASGILPQNPNRVFTSTSKRAIDTAKIIAPEKDILPDDRLLERGWGAGQDGDETDAAAKERLTSFLNNITETRKGENVLVVTHGGLIRLTEQIIENGEGSDRIENCQIICYSKKEPSSNSATNYFRYKETTRPFDTSSQKNIVKKGVSIYFVRHGESVSNRDGILAGGMDFPLTEDGVIQVAMVADEMSRLGIRFEKIFTSPLSRALDTAKIIAEKCEISIGDVIILDDLSGCGGGDLEGRPYADWYAVPTNELVEKHGAESYSKQRERIGRAMVEILRRSNTGDNQLIVSHSSVFQVMQAINNDIHDETETFRQEKPAPGRYKRTTF